MREIKIKVLRKLCEAEGSPVSGGAMADEFGLSRTAIWKAVNGLKAEGYSITSDKSRGYTLLPGSKLSAFIIEQRLKNPAYAELIEIFDELDSTNNRAKKYAAGLVNPRPVERIIIADRQTAGKGRRGRSFYSPQGSGVYISFLLTPRTGAADAIRLTTAASVAVCIALENVFGLSPVIKWVNDVYLDNKKICGILTEAVTDFESGNVESAVIGIGINVSTSGFPSDVAKVAGSLGLEGGADRNRLIAELINCLTGFLDIRDGCVYVKDYIGEYRKRSMVIGHRIKILNTGEEAEALDIDKNGGLVVRVKGSGDERTLSSGEISIRLAEQEENR